jgi:hypothetical protein
VADGNDQTARLGRASAVELCEQQKSFPPTWNMGSRSTTGSRWLSDKLCERNLRCVFYFDELSRNASRATEVTDSDDDDDDVAKTLRDSCHPTLITGVVQPTFIYYWVCEVLSGNSAIVWSPRGRLWCSGWEAHQKKIAVSGLRNQS